MAGDERHMGFLFWVILVVLYGETDGGMPGFSFSRCDEVCS
jgi:hypothetical protein